MKIKYKEINSLKHILTGLYLALVVLVGVSFAQPASAKMDYSPTFINKIQKKAEAYCASIKQQDNQFASAWYEDCVDVYVNTSRSVYFASSQDYINNLMQSGCSVQVIWGGGKSQCSATVESVNVSQSLLKQGGSKPKPKPDKPDKKPDKKPKPAANKPPPISDCNSLDNDLKKKCIKQYRACNPPPESLSYVPKCKKKVINKFKKKQQDRKEKAKRKAEADKYKGRYLCGNIRNGDGDLSDDNYYTKFNFGCVGESGPPGLNPIEDLAFALLRFLSVGVGIAVVIAVIGSGIQYISSEGNAEVTAKAKKRIRSALIGLVVYIFAFSLFQYLVPGGLFWTGSWLNIELITRLL